MRWELQLAVLLGLSFTDVASLAQRPPDDESLASTAFDLDAYPTDAGYFDSDGVVRFQLIQGRLCLDTPRHRKGTQNCEQDGIYESITVTATRGVPSVHYIHRSPKQEIILSAQNASTIRIESRLTGSGEVAVIDQPTVHRPGRNQIRFTVKSDAHSKSADQESEILGSTLLHLRSADQHRFDQHFGCLIRQLLQGQALQSLSEETDAAIIRRVQKMKPLDLAAIHDAIDQLSSPKNTIRRSAERYLLSQGSTIVPIIHSRSTDDLDAEQLARLRAITSTLQPMSDDTAASLAALLVNDVDHWTRMAARMNPNQIQMANHYLKRSGLNTLNELANNEPIERVASSDPNLY